MANLQQLYGIIRNEPLTLNIFIHLIHQLLMEITPRNLVNDINLICPQYTEKIIYIAKNKQPELQDFDTIPLGTCCDLVLNTTFCDQNKHKLIFHPSRRTFLFPFQLPNGKYRTVIVNTRDNTLTYFTTGHWMLRSEKMQAKTIMQAIDDVIQTQTVARTTNVTKFQHSIKRVGSLTSQCRNDTGFIIYNFIQNFILGKETYPTVDIPLLSKQVAVQLTHNKYIELKPTYKPMVN